MSDWKQKLIDEKYQGDVERFEADFADEVLMGQRNAVHWVDLIADATILPHLSHIARGLIEINLGCLPGDSTIMPFEPYMRVLIQQFRDNQLSDDEFLDQTEDHIRLIRNSDVRYNTCLKYHEDIYTNYHQTFVPYGYTVKERLTRFLGYEPDLDCSLIAEMWMRDLIAHEEVKLGDPPTEADWKAITLIKYREVLLEYGQEAADASTLLSKL